MLPRADITGTRPVGAIEPTRPIALVGDVRQEAQDAFNRLAQHSVGKQFQAEIMSRLTDGSFVVKISDTAVRMDLPGRGAQVGDVLDLILVSTQPRPTFLLGGPGRDAGTSLSNTGRLIDNLLRAAQKEGAPTALVGKVPLLPSPATNPAQVATALKDTLTFSGLFYESHVGQWASGDRSLTDLMREPQARNSNPLLVAAALHASASSASAPLADIAAQPSSHPADVEHGVAAREVASPTEMRDAAEGGRSLVQLPRAAQPAAGKPLATETSELSNATTRITDSPTDTSTPAILSSSSTSPTATERTVPHETMSSESVRMISLQLNTLEQQRVAWQGELWPGQPMEWEVTKDAPNSKVDAAQRSWQSVVRFELPTLGAVAASIRLTGDRLQMQVRAADEATALLLRTHGSELSAALDAAGSPLDLLMVKRDESV